MKTVSKFLKSLKISTPSLILDKKRVIRNIEKMVGKAEADEVKLRPHFKTHQSAEIGNWFRDFRIDSIAVSSLDMALYFTEHGWSDITVAFLVNTLEIDKINYLASRIKLNLLVDSEHALSSLGHGLEHKVDLWIKVDVGYGRTGLSWNDFEYIFYLVQKIQNSTKLEFAGLLTHCGHSYQATTIDEIQRIHNQAISRLSTIKEKAGCKNIEISIGDTPTCSIVNNFDGVDEIRPGNFVFYDLMQNEIGSCGEDEIAVAVACPVVGKYKERNQIVIYGGAAHLSKESIFDRNSRKIFGYITSLEDGTWGAINRRATVVSLSQEHGIIQVDYDLFNKIEIADLLPVVPVHSCLTCNLYKEYKTLQGEVISRL